MSDDIETAAAATPRAVLERHILDVNVPKSETEWWAHHEIVALRKALYDRHAANKKAWSAIMRATGKERGLPDNKEVVAFYVAEVERLEKEGREARMAEHQTFMDAASINVENDSLRAKLDRATGALRDAATALEDSYPNEEFNYSNYDHDTVCRIGGMMDECASASIAAAEKARAIISELSADAPAQQVEQELPPAQPFKFEIDQPVRKKSGYRFDGRVKMRGRLESGERYVVECEAAKGLLHIFSDTQLAARDDAPAKFDAEAILKRLKESAAPAQHGGGWGDYHIIYEHEGQAAEPGIDHPGGHENAPAQQTQISDEVREAMVEAEKALEHISSFDDHGQLRPGLHRYEANNLELNAYNRLGDVARAALTKLRSVMK